MQEYQENCQVQRLEILSKPNNESLDNAFFRLTLHAPRISAAAQPGQFVMLSCASSHDPLLRRPFSIHRIVAQHSLQLLIRVVGRGTRMLAGLQAGARLDLLGPLGRGFQDVERPASPFQNKAQAHPNPQENNDPVCLIGGGIGIAPLLFLADYLLPRFDQSRRKHCVALLGGRVKDEVAELAASFSDLGYTVESATDDGGFGLHGMVTALLPPHLPRMRKVYCCGPHAMMAAVAAQCRAAGVDCEVSLEATMACGLGACLGCTVHNSEGGYLHVCKEGPVVAAGKVLWNR